MSQGRQVSRERVLRKAASVTKVVTSLRKVLQNFGVGTRRLFVAFEALAQTVAEWRSGRLLPSSRSDGVLCACSTDLVLGSQQQAAPGRGWTEDGRGTAAVATSAGPSLSTNGRRWAMLLAGDESWETWRGFAALPCRWTERGGGKGEDCITVRKWISYSPPLPDVNLDSACKCWRSINQSIKTLIFLALLSRPPFMKAQKL